MVPRGLVIIGLAAWARSPRRRRCAAASCFRPSRARPITTPHWRVENGVLPVGPRVPDPRLDVDRRARGRARAPKVQLPNATVDDARAAHGSARRHAVPVGGTVEFKNDDRVPHTLFVEKATTLMPPAPTPAGQTRAQKFYASGEYRVRDEEYPHVDGTVLVVQTPYVARLDDKGNFKLEVPEGKYTLKVCWRDNWVVTQALEVTGRTSEVNVQVPATAATPPAAGAKPDVLVEDLVRAGRDRRRAGGRGGAAGARGRCSAISSTRPARGWSVPSIGVAPAQGQRAQVDRHRRAGGDRRGAGRGARAGDQGAGRSRPRAQDRAGAAALLQRQDEGGPGAGPPMRAGG